MNFGVIGTSWISEEYIKGALNLDYWNFTALYSRNKDTGLKFAEQFKMKNIYTDLTEFAKSNNFEAVYIASPNALHYEHIKLMLENGKHVICEKPLVTTSEQLNELYKIADENNLIFLEAIMFMHFPDKKILEDAMTKIGDINMVTFDFCQRSSKYDAYLKGELPNIFNPQMHTGALMDLGVYCVYPALYLFGEPKNFNISYIMLDSGVDASVIINLVYSDKLVCLRFTKISQASANSDIQGNLGTISIGSISRLDDMKIIYKDGKEEFLAKSKQKHILMGYEAESFYKFIQDPKNEYYTTCKNMSLLVNSYMEKFRKEMDLPF